MVMSLVKQLLLFIFFFFFYYFIFYFFNHLYLEVGLHSCVVCESWCAMCFFHWKSISYGTNKTTTTTTNVVLKCKVKVKIFCLRQYTVHTLQPLTAQLTLILVTGIILNVCFQWYRNVWRLYDGTLHRRHHSQQHTAQCKHKVILEC